MNNSGKIYRKVVITAAIVLVITILVFSSRQPTEPKDENSQYTIGVFSHTERMNISYIQTGELARRDINDFCIVNELPIFFNFTYDCAEDQPPEALEITERFHEQGINIIVGYGFSSMLDNVDYYGKNMGVVMVSPSGTNIHRGIYPNIFTIGPTEPTQMRALSCLITDCNVSRIIVFKPSQYSRYSIFEDTLNASLVDCVIVEAVPYALSSDYTVPTKYIQSLEEAVQDSMDLGETGVLFTGGAELEGVLTSALNSSVLCSIKWFATDLAYAKPSFVKDKAVSDTEVFLLREAPLDNIEYSRLVQRYEDVCGDTESRFQPYLYDALWISALTLINTGTTCNETIVNEFPAVAEVYEGVTGNCALDSNNERYSSTYQILCYTISDNHITLWRCGVVNRGKSIKWLETPIQLE